MHSIMFCMIQDNAFCWVYQFTVIVLGFTLLQFVNCKKKLSSTFCNCLKTFFSKLHLFQLISCVGFIPNPTQNSSYIHLLNSFQSKNNRSCKDQDLCHSFHFIATPDVAIGLMAPDNFPSELIPLAPYVTNPSHILRTNCARIFADFDSLWLTMRNIMPLSFQQFHRVIHLSDRASADGRYINPEFLSRGQFDRWHNDYLLAYTTPC